MCVCVCAPRTPHGGLSDTSALEISSGGGSGLNSPDRSPDFEKPWCRVSHLSTVGYVLSECKQVGEN